MNRKTRTPNLLTYVVSAILIIGVLTMDLSAAAELCNYGAFTSFIIVCIAVLILRKVDPDRPRPFKVPFSPWFPLMGIFCLSGLMLYFIFTSATIMSAILFPIVMVLGVIVYAFYGYRKNRRREKIVEEMERRAQAIKEERVRNEF